MSRDSIVCTIANISPHLQPQSWSERTPNCLRIESLNETPDNQPLALGEMAIASTSYEAPYGCIAQPLFSIALVASARALRL
jgi:hypothetical protein